jgi:hypothetical protein
MNLMRALLAMFWTCFRWDMYAAELGDAMKEYSDG